jgi:glutathione S-transferase
MCKFMKVDVPRTTAGWVPLEEALAVLLQRLSAGPYLLGESFSALDTLYGTAFAQLSQLLPKSPLLEEYVQRIITRPAYARALAKDAA